MKKLLYVAAIVVLITYFIFGAPMIFFFGLSCGVIGLLWYLVKSFKKHPQVKNSSDGKFKTFNIDSKSLTFNAETGRVFFSGNLYAEVAGGTEEQKRLYATPGQEFELWGYKFSSESISQKKYYTKYKSGTGTAYVNGQMTTLNVSVSDGVDSYTEKMHNAISVRLYFEPNEAGHVWLGLGQVNDYLCSEVKNSLKEWFDSLGIDKKVKQYKEEQAIEMEQRAIQRELTRISKDKEVREKNKTDEEKARNSLHQILQKYSFEWDDDKTKYLFWRTDDQLADFIVLHPTKGLIVGRNGQVEWAGSVKGAKVEKDPKGGITIIVRDAEYENTHDKKKRIMFFDNHNKRESIDEWSDRIELFSEK